VSFVLLPYAFTALLPPPNLLLLHLATIICCWRSLRSPYCYCCCCCCCCYWACLCLRALMVRLGCKQPWCVTLFAAPAAPPVSCWAALICSACASITAWFSKTKLCFFGLPGGHHRCFLRLSLSPFRFCLQQLGSVGCQLLLLLLLKCCCLLNCRCDFKKAAFVPLSNSFWSYRCCWGCCWGRE